MNKSEFESKYLTSYVSTAIEKTSRIAEDKSLHEIELITNKTGSGNVTLIGYLFAKEREEGNYSMRENNDKIKIFENEKCVVEDLFDVISTIQVGGERNYGFGRIELEKGEIKEKYKIWNLYRIDTEKLEVIFNTNKINALSHLLIKEKNGKEHFGKITSMKGELEPLVGREWGKDGGVGHRTPFGGIGLAPGSEFVLKNSSNTTVEEGKTFKPEDYKAKIIIGEYGLWKFES